MTALLAKYLAKPTHRNAMAVSKYNRAHPLAMLMLNELELGLLGDAIAVAQGLPPTFPA